MSSQFTETEVQLSQLVSDAIMELEPLQHHCHLVALAHSGLSKEEFDYQMNKQGTRVYGLLEQEGSDDVTEEEALFDESPQYKLYWSIYNTTMQRITLLSTASWYNPLITT